MYPILLPFGKICLALIYYFAVNLSNDCAEIYSNVARGFSLAMTKRP